MLSLCKGKEVQCVYSEVLLGQDFRTGKALREHHDLCNEFVVRNAHGHLSQST